MDPRPIHFQYTKSRPNNPTYRSYGLFDSLHPPEIKEKHYLLRKERNQMFYNSLIHPQEQKRQNRRYQQKSVLELSSIGRDQKNANPQAKPTSLQTKSPKNQQSSNLSSSRGQMGMGRKLNSESVLQSQEMKKVQPSKLSRYGENIVKRNFGQQVVYEKQQHTFNIINLYPNYHPIKLHQFPRLTLEDRLIAALPVSKSKEKHIEKQEYQD